MNPFLHRLRTRLWDLETAARHPRPLIVAGRYVFVLVRDLMEGQLSLRAMSLVYTTLLSIVPLLALAFSVLKALGAHNALEPVLLELLRPLGEQAAGVVADEQVLGPLLVGAHRLVLRLGGQLQEEVRQPVVTQQVEHEHEQVVQLARDPQALAHPGAVGQQRAGGAQLGIEAALLLAGLGLLLETRQIRKMISSYVGENKEFERQYLAGELELEFTPQGTLAERMRAGGAGIPGFYTKTGVGTVVAEGKEHKDFDGETYILERGIRADLALVKAWRGDRAGNLVYRKTAQNFNPLAAACGRVTVAEVEELVEVGELDPDEIDTPGIYVQRVVLNPHPEKRIEQRTVRP